MPPSLTGCALLAWQRTTVCWSCLWLGRQPKWSHNQVIQFYSWPAVSLQWLPICLWFMKILEKKTTTCETRKWQQNRNWNLPPCMSSPSYGCGALVQKKQWRTKRVTLSLALRASVWYHNSGHSYIGYVVISRRTSTRVLQAGRRSLVCISRKLQA